MSKVFDEAGVAGRLIVSIADTTNMLGLSTSKVRDLMRRGVLVAAKIDRRVVISLESVMRLAAHGTDGRDQ